MTTIESQINFRKKVIESYERLSECLKKEISEYKNECSNKVRLEIEVYEIDNQILPSKRKDLEAYVEHSKRIPN